MLLIVQGLDVELALETFEGSNVTEHLFDREKMRTFVELSCVCLFEVPSEKRKQLLD